MTLLLLQVVFAGNLTFLRENLFLVPAMTLFGLLYALMASFTMLALSSLSTSARYVAVLYAGALLFTEAIFGTLRGVTGSSWLSWLSFRANLAQIGDVVFRIPPAIRHAVAGVACGRFRRDRGFGVGTGAPRPRRGDRHVSAAVVSAQSLSKWYGQVIGLNDVTVDIPSRYRRLARTERGRKVDVHETR